MRFGDLRGWIAHLKREGELHEVESQVDWNCELGTITRRAFGNGDGPALLFRNIKDYHDNARCRQLFTGGLSNYSRVAMMFGLPKTAPITDLVMAARKAFSGRLPPVKVATGPVKARSTPTAAQFSTVARTSGTSSARSTPARSARRSAAASRVIRKFEAIDAAAW